MTALLTQDEAELYDRQIRLWGVGAQGKIRKSKILMLGFSGLASEVAKTVVLAGIDTLTIVDDQPLQPDDIYSNLFCRASSDGENMQFRTHAVIPKLKALNPSVRVNIENISIKRKIEEDFNNYDLVTLHSFLPIGDICKINEKCRDHEMKFYFALDFGLFGFMFNDLGPDYEYSYEEYNPVNDKEESENVKTDEEANTDGAVELNESTDDLDDDTSDGEFSRPKKRRRLRSPPKEKTIETVENEKQTKIGKLSFGTFKSMISLEDIDFNKSTSSALLISIVMLKFFSAWKHVPRREIEHTNQDDERKLRRILTSLESSKKIPESVLKKLDAEWIDNIHGSLSPICAIVGGVVGQDIIRALSHKDIPIFNTFTFDGLTMNGIVNKIGIPRDERLASQPVVRDVVQIDDSDDE